MNSQFNYATFIDLFLESDEEHEPYGISQTDPALSAPATESVPDDNPFSSPS